MKKIFTILVSAVFAGLSAQTTLAQWNFDTSSTAATVGTGSLALVGGVVENVQTGTTACNCPYVSGNPSTGKSYTTKTYPAQGTASGTAGIQINTSTVNYAGISATVDVYGSNTASKFVQMQYTTDGTNWTFLGSPTIIPTTANGNTVVVSWVTLTSGTLPTTADNNANFAIRVVSVFDPANNNAYTPVNNAGAGTTPASSYSPAGALRFDNINIIATTSLGTSEINAAKAKFVKNTLVTSTITFGSKTNVQIVNINGQVVRTASVNEGTSLDVSSLEKGIYIVTGVVDGQKVSQKITKQ